MAKRKKKCNVEGCNTQAYFEIFGGGICKKHWQEGGGDLEKVKQLMGVEEPDDPTEEADFDEEEEGDGNDGED